MIFDLACADDEQWTITDGCGVCPDCAALVPAGSMSNHVRWHQTLVCQLLAVCANQDQLAQHTLELNPELPGDCVRLVHELQVAGLRKTDKTDQ